MGVEGSDEVRTGGCLCGAVRFVVRGAVRPVTYCHCSQCRRQTGLYFAASNASEADVVVTGGEAVSWYRASEEAGRGFCRTCGSALFWKLDGSDVISIMAGSFDQPSGLVGGEHIFCADKGDFYQLSDGLPQFDRSRPGIPVAGD